jgi:hypothetical protein
LKEIPFASLTNAIDVKIESSNGLFDWLNNLFQPIKKPVRTLSIFTRYIEKCIFLKHDLMVSFTIDLFLAENVIP